MKIIAATIITKQKKQKKIAAIKNNIAIRIAGKVLQYIDASMNRFMNLYYSLPVPVEWSAGRPG